MSMVEESKREHKVAALMLEMLEKITSKLVADEKINTSQVEVILEFFKNYTNSVHQQRTGQSPDRKAGNELDLGQRPSVEYEQSLQLIRKMRLSLTQYQRGADKAGAEFAKNAGSFIDLLKNRINKEDKSVLPFDNNINTNNKQEEGHKPLENLKGMYLVD